MLTVVRPSLQARPRRVARSGCDLNWHATALNVSIPNGKEKVYDSIP
jgi:hypothetical protein